MKDQAAPSCTDSCPAGRYCGKKTVSPVPCQAGTYCPEESAAETACPAGTYSPDQLATSDKACLDCGLGTFCPERSKQPTACAPGTYGNESRLQACYVCAPGTFQGFASQTACEVCKPGSYCQKGALAPTECAAGTFSNATDQACNVCAPGTFQRFASQTACEVCKPGSYCRKGASAPTECAAGTFSNATNLSSAEKCEPCTAGFYCERGAIESIPCPMGKVGIGVLTAEAFCTTCPGETTSLLGTTRCTFCKTGFYESFEINETVAKVECAPCLKPDGGANCLETTTSGSDSLTHGSTSLATIRIEPKYWRLSANSTTLSMCLESANGSSSCVGGSDAGDENDYKQGYTGSGYCKAGHTGPLCQVCNTSDFYFDAVEAMECIQCPRISERLHLPMGFIGVLIALLLMAGIIKRSPFPRSAGSSVQHSVRASRCKRCSERLRQPIAGVKRVVARIRQLEIVPKCKLLFTCEWPPFKTLK